VRIVEAFAPRANEREDLIGSDSTDVLAEGQNLQDCGTLLNYDLHWNPTRMVQRAGRIDRIGSEFDVLWINNMFPDEGLEQLLKLVESLTKRIETIDSYGLLDASVLGETVHPQSFNALRRIRDEDDTIIEEEEQYAELLSPEFLQNQVRRFLQEGGEESVAELPDGIHSGLVRENARGVFFYFQADGESTRHFWRYLDLRDGSILDNRFLIANLIACSPDTPRVVDPEMFEQVFDLQEKAIEDILKSVEQTAAMQAAPKIIDPVQQTLSAILQKHLSHPDVDRNDALEILRFLRQTMPKGPVKRLRAIQKEYQRDADLAAVLAALRQARQEYGTADVVEEKAEKSLKREDLRLICFDFVSS
jgi:hypothetical protein